MRRAIRIAQPGFLHVVSTQRLLCALPRRKSSRFDPELIRDIRQLAAGHDRSPRGAIRAIAVRYAIPEGSVRMIVHRTRQGREPKSWGRVKWPSGALQ
jgi:hypothetical protein